MTVNCCHLNNTVELATCGLGGSCAGSCSALGASLCPSGNCTGDCEMPFEQEAESSQIDSRQWSAATKPSRAFAWCSSRCNVWSHKGCCYNPICRRRRPRPCRWFNYLTGQHHPFNRSRELTIYFFQERLARCPAACPTATGVARCRRFPSMEPPSWTEMRSHTQVIIFGQCKFNNGFPNPPNTSLKAH